MAYIRDKKYFNLQCVKLTFLSSFQYKARISAFSRRARCEICSKLTIKGVRKQYVRLTRHPWRRSGLFIVNFEHNSFLVIVFLLLTFISKLPAGVVVSAGINSGKVSIYGENSFISCPSKMHGNTWGRVTYLVDLMFRRLNKHFMGLYSGWAYIREAYTRNAN